MKTRICSAVTFLLFFVFFETHLVIPAVTFDGNNERRITGSSLSSGISIGNDSELLDSLLPGWTAVCDLGGTRYGEVVSSGDFNGDGFADIAVADGNYNSLGAVFIYFGSPTGPPIIPSQIILGESPGFSDDIEGKSDINNDGFSDLIIGDPWTGGTGKVHIHYGSLTGLSDTANVVILPVGTGIQDFGYSVTAADLNGDGYSDVIASIRGQLDTLIVAAYIYNGSATGISGNYPSSVFAFDHPVYPHNRAYSGLGDMNGDGFDDAAILVSGTRLFVYRGNDSVNFVRSHYREYIIPGYVIMSESAGDVNSDTFGDMIVRGSGETYLFYGSPDAPGPIPDWTKPMGNCYVYNPVSSAGDFDSDGYDDVVIGECETATLFLGSAAGLSTPRITFPDSSHSIASGDINGDGYSDVIISEYEKVHAYYGRDLSANVNTFIHSVSPGMNSISVSRTSNIQVEFVNDMQPSTINNSNIKVFGLETGLIPASVSYDLSSRTATIYPLSDFKTGEKIQVTLQSGIQSVNDSNITQFTWTFIVEALSGNGVFSESSVLDSQDFESGLDKISAGDIDSDGDLDLVVCNNNLKIYKNNGNAQFTVAQSHSIDCRDFTLGDYDGDGDLDILSNSAALDLFRNDGSGNFVYSASSPGGGNSADLGDLDGDGDLDIALMFSNEIRWYLNNGYGSFIERVKTFQDISGYLPFVLNLTLGDLDNDGDQDLTVVVVQIHSPSYTDFLTLLNDGNAIFSFGASTDAWFANSVNTDLDGDADLDIIGAGALYFNDGSGQFTGAPFASGTGTCVLPGDFDADRDIDAVFTDENSGNVKLYKNDANGSLSFYANSICGANPFRGATGDFDSDGDIDMAIMNEGGHANRSDISIMLNNACPHPSFTITGSSFISVNSVNNVYVSTTDNGYWDISNYDSTEASIPPNSTGDTVLVSAGSNYGHFVLYFIASYDCGGDTLLSKHVSVDNPNPVELLDFIASVSKCNIVLSWFTSSELNNSGFEVQRAVGNNEWSRIGFVSGGGTTNEPKDYSFTDRNLETGKYKYRLKQLDFNGNFEYFELAEVVSIGIPDKYDLSQNYPNPFNPVTTINYDLPNDGIVTIKVYDMLGRELKVLVNEMKPAGYHKIQFNAVKLASGAYFYRMTAGDFVAVKKFVLLK